MEVFSVARAASDHKIKCEVRKEEEGVLNPYKMLSFREIVFDVIFLIRVRKRYEIKHSMGYLHKNLILICLLLKILSFRVLKSNTV